ncbi:MAG TPA: hypothetical protein PK200_16705, partial [Spirochaetota bacterium]|nr:hypothetical protein [Spirochaetota bacterium]
MWIHQETDGKGLLFQRAVSVHPWNYNYPSNFHSIVTTGEYSDYSSIKCKIDFLKRNNAVELMLFFNAEFSEQSRYHNLYAFRLDGDAQRFRKAVFLKTSVIDPEKMSARNNFKVEEISQTFCTISLDRPLDCDIQFSGKTTSLYINNTRILSVKTETPLNRGKIGLGIKNSQINVYDFKLFKKNELLFHDDFSKDSMKRLKATLQRVPAK